MKQLTLALLVGTMPFQILPANCADTAASKNAAAVYERAWTFYRQRDLNQALKCIDTAIELSPTAPEYYLKASILQAEQENYFSAVLAIEKAISLVPDRAEYWHMKAQLLRSAARPQPALECVQHAIKLQPSAPDMIMTEGLCYVDLGRWQEAETALTKSITIYEHNFNSTNVDGHTFRSMAAAKLKHWPLVVEDSNVIIAEKKKTVPLAALTKAYRNKAQALVAMGKIEQARSTFNKALATWPDDRQLLVAAKAFFESIGDKADADLQAKHIKEFDSDMLPP